MHQTKFKNEKKKGTNSMTKQHTPSSHHLLMTESLLGRKSIFWTINGINGSTTDKLTPIYPPNRVLGGITKIPNDKLVSTVEP